MIRLKTTQIVLIVISMLFFLACHIFQAFVLYIHKVYFFGLWIHISIIIDTLLLIAFITLIVVIITLILEINNK